MDRDTARKLIPLVNNEEAWEGLIGYIDSRIHSLRNELENVSIVDNRPIQGAVGELRKFKNNFRVLVLEKSK